MWQHSVYALGHVEPHPRLRLAALLHDCGKPACFSMDEQGVGHFYGHGEHSHRIASQLLKELACPAELRHKICDLVLFHDAMLPLERPKLRRWVAKLGPQGVLDLVSLKRADNTALTEAVYYILLSLMEPLHGYGIMQNVEKLSGGRLRLAAGTLYGAISTMLEKGWITALDGAADSRKKEYVITETGRDVLRAEYARLKELVENGRAVLETEEETK